jgi:hypothetical protein
MAQADVDLADSVVTYIDGGVVDEHETPPPILANNAECQQLLASLAAHGVANFEVVVSYRSGYGMIVRLTPANFGRRVRLSARRHAAVRELQDALGKIVGHGVDEVVGASVVADFDYIATVAVWPSERTEKQGLVATMSSFVPSDHVDHLDVRLI